MLSVNALGPPKGADVSAPGFWGVHDGETRRGTAGTSPCAGFSGMRIAYVLDVPLSGNGIVRLTKSHASLIESLGGEVLIIGLAGTDSVSPFVGRPVRLHAIRPLIGLSGRAPTLVQAVMRRPEIQTELRAFSPSLVIACRQGGLLACWGATKSPLWYFVHQSEFDTARLGSRWLLRNRRSRDLLLRLNRLLYRIPDRVLVPSTAIMPETRRSAPTAQIAVAPPLFGIPRGSRQSECSRVDPNHLRLLWVGRFVPIKGPIRAVEWLAAVRDQGGNASLTMVGAGELMRATEEHAAQLGLTSYVTLVGQASAAMVQEYMRSSDVLLITSEAESFGMVAYEAVMSGLRIVGRPVGVLPSLTAQLETVIVTEDLSLQNVETVFEGSTARAAEALCGIMERDRIAVANLLLDAR